MKINCVVIDANQQSVCVLKESVEQFNQLELVASFNNPLLAIDFLMEHTIHFVFIAPEFKNAFDNQIISQFAGNPLFIITDNNSECANGNFFSGNANYILSPLAYSDFFYAITSMQR